LEDLLLGLSLLREERGNTYEAPIISIKFAQLLPSASNTRKRLNENLPYENRRGEPSSVEYKVEYAAR